MLPCAVFFCNSRTFFCSTNLQTILMPKQLHGLKNTFTTTRERLLQSLTTDTSLMMLPAGYLSLTAEKVIHLKETIQAGLNRKTSVLPLKTNMNLNVRKKFSENWNGFTWVQKEDRQNTKSILHAITSLWHRKAKNSLKMHRFLFLQALALVVR